MSSRHPYSSICHECGNLTKTKVYSDGIIPVYCQKCLSLKEQKLFAITNNKLGFQKSFKVKLDKDEQILSALNTVGEAFRHHGGVTLMLTEHVENGIDGIEDLKKDSKNIKMMEKYQGKIEIIIDEDNSRVIIIDNGSGITHPIWISENPLKSRKTGESHQHGEFGRGLQGFRGFCNNLEYITKREEISQEELSDNYIKEGLDDAKQRNIDGRTIKLKLDKESIITYYLPISSNEFKKYTQNYTGTIAIFSNWSLDDFESLLKDKSKLFERIQHHFRVPLESGIVKISLQYGKNKPILIEPRTFSIDDDEMDLFELPDKEVINPHTNEVYGTIQFRLYRAAPRYEHRYKSPFLLVGDRPLGNSELLQLEELSNQAILKSPYITGYIVANFLKPDSLRLSPKHGDEYRQFIAHVRNSLRDLKPLLEKYEAAFRVANKGEENQKLILQVQSFLKDQNIPLNLIGTTKSGELFAGINNGDKKEERLSSTIGEVNQGRITRDGTVEAVILYKKNKQGETTSKTRLKVKIDYKDPKKDGLTSTTVFINPNLTSKDGRIRKRNYIGPGLDNYRGDLDLNISKWDASKYLVLINEKHEVYEMYEKQRKESIKYKNDVYSQKQKSLIQECYLWQVIKNCGKNMDQEKKEKVFWESKYKFFLHKENI